MSNLNINNTDVQRIININNELQNKIELCSCLTFKTMEAFELHKESLRNMLTDEQIKDISDHFELMTNFQNTHLIIKKEEQKDAEKSVEMREDDLINEIDGEPWPQNDYIIVENLKDIDGI